MRIRYMGTGLVAIAVLVAAPWRDGVGQEAVQPKSDDRPGASAPSQEVPKDTKGSPRTERPDRPADRSGRRGDDPDRGERARERRPDQPRSPDDAGPGTRGPNERRSDRRPDGGPGDFDGRPGEGRPPGPGGFGGGGFGRRPDGGPDGPRLAPGGFGPNRFGPNWPSAPDLEQLRRSDPQMYELEVSDQEFERQVFEKSQQFRHAPADKREFVKSELSDLVGKHFEVRQKRRELALQRMEKELGRMRDELKRRNELREQIVNRRLSELTGDRSDLDF